MGSTFGREPCGYLLYQSKYETALTERDQILVYTKPGTIHFWSSEDVDNSGHDATLRLNSPPLCIGSSSLSSPAGPSTCFPTVFSFCLNVIPPYPAGFNYYTHEDRLVVSLADGSFHVFNTVSTHPSSTSSSLTDGHVSTKETVNTVNLSQSTRELFGIIEQQKVKPKSKNLTRDDVMAVGTAVAYGELGAFMWLYEYISLFPSPCRSNTPFRAKRPKELTYVTEGQQTGLVVFAQLWAVHPDLLLEQIKHIVHIPGHGGSPNTDTSRYRHLILSLSLDVRRSPIGLLRGTLLHLRVPSMIDSLGPGLIELLGADAEDESAIESTSSVGANRVVAVDDSREARPRFRDGLQQALFRSSSLARSRLKLMLAKFCAVS